MSKAKVVLIIILVVVLDIIPLVSVISTNGFNSVDWTGFLFIQLLIVAVIFLIWLLDKKKRDKNMFEFQKNIIDIQIMIVDSMKLYVAIENFNNNMDFFTSQQTPIKFSDYLSITLKDGKNVEGFYSTYKDGEIVLVNEEVFRISINEIHAISISRGDAIFKLPEHLPKTFRLNDDVLLDHFKNIYESKGRIYEWNSDYSYLMWDCLNTLQKKLLKESEDLFTSKLEEIATEFISIKEIRSKKKKDKFLKALIIQQEVLNTINYILNGQKKYKKGMTIEEIDELITK